MFVARPEVVAMAFTSSHGLEPGTGPTLTAGRPGTALFLCAQPQQQVGIWPSATRGLGEANGAPSEGGPAVERAFVKGGRSRGAHAESWL